jgi:nucleoside-diphosphate-sugar epimerase
VSLVLVTGASGFVGRALVPALVTAGHTVRAASRRAPGFAPPVEAAVHGNLNHGDPGAANWPVLVDGVDFIVHLAGIAHTGPGVPAADYDRVNHRATAALAAAARAAGTRRMVFVSSIRAQTGAQADHVLIEADAPAPSDAYGRSKLAAETAVARSGVDFTVLRPVLAYGPGVKGNLQALARLAALWVPVPFGGLANRRSLLGLGNLVSAITFALGHPDSSGETYVVADLQPVSPAEIIKALRAGLGRSPGLVTMPPGIIRFGLAMLGRRGSWDQLGGQLVVFPGKLLAAGWRPEADTIAGLTAMARGGLP